MLLNSFHYGGASLCATSMMTVSCCRAWTAFEPLLAWVFPFFWAIKARALPATVKCETLVTIVLWWKHKKVILRANSQVQLFKCEWNWEIQKKNSLWSLNRFDTRDMAPAVIKAEFSAAFNEWNVEHKVSVRSEDFLPLIKGIYRHHRDDAGGESPTSLNKEHPRDWLPVRTYSAS